MNIKKVMAASFAMIAAGATLGATYGSSQLSGYVSQTAGTLTSPMVVIGSTAGDPVNYPLDVVAAADLAAHVAGYATTPVATTSGSKQFAISGGTGKEVSTENTKIYLDDSLGKAGLRSTMTGAELPDHLATGTVVDKNSTSIRYDQYLFLTPSSTTSASYTIQFERPSSSSGDDGTYSIGRFTTSPTSTDYFAKYRISLRKDVNLADLVGKTLTIGGDTYTVLSDSTSLAADTPKLVGTRAAASQTLNVANGEVDILIGTVTHKIRVVGTSDADTVVIAVTNGATGVSEQSSVDKGKTQSIAGVDIYIDDVFHISTTDTSQNGAKLLIGAEKTIFQHGSKIKVGTNEDNVEGTWVNITRTGNKISTIDVTLGAAASSITDNLKMGSKFTLPGFPRLALFFPGMSEGPTADGRSVLKISGSGDNLLQGTFKDDSGNEATFTWAYKTSSTGSTFLLADSNGNRIQTRERRNVTLDQYVILDAGDFPHLMQLTSIDSSMLSFTLRDVFSGESTKYDLATADNGRKTIYIDGQAYYADMNMSGGGSSSQLAFSWGDNAGATSVGDAITVWPAIKGLRGERLAFYNNTAITFNATNNSEIQLPTGAVRISVQYSAGNYTVMNLTAIADEHGEASACTTTPCINNLTLGNDAYSVTQQINFTLGKTSTGGILYNIRNAAVSGIGPDNGSSVDNQTFNISIIGTSTETITQPSLILVEEKDDAGDRYALVIQSSTETSGSNNVAIPATPIFTANEDSQARGTDSTITDSVDLYGTYVVKTTTGQDTLTVYYPDEQVFAVIGVGTAEGTGSVGGATGSTVNAAVVITSPIAKLASEVSTATLTSDLILVGGPCANSLVEQLAADNSTGVPSCSSWSLTTGLIKEVTNAFGSGRKALVVAGTTATDTRNLAALVMGGTLSYQV